MHCALSGAPDRMQRSEDAWEHCMTENDRFYDGNEGQYPVAGKDEEKAEYCLLPADSVVQSFMCVHHWYIVAHPRQLAYHNQQRLNTQYLLSSSIAAANILWCLLASSMAAANVLWARKRSACVCMVEGAGQA